MATRDIQRLLAELDHCHQRQLEMWPTLSNLGSEVSEEFLRDCESVARLLDTKMNELRAIASTLPREDWDAALAECRERVP